MHRSIVAALAAVSALASPAFADEAALKALEKLDADSPMVVVARPRGPRALFEWLRKFGGATRTVIQDAVDEIFRDFKAATAIDPADPAAWAELGLDLDAPIAAGFVAVDVVAAEKAFVALTGEKRDPKKDAKVARPFLRARIVAKLSDEAKFKALVEKIAGVAQGEVAILGKTDAKGVAAAMEVDEKLGGAVSKALTKAKVFAAARDHGHFVTLRIDGGWAVVDMVMQLGSEVVKFDWKRDGAAWLKVATRTVAKGGASSLLGKGAGLSLGDADLGIWLEPSRVLDLAKVTGWNNVLHAVVHAPDAERKQLAEMGGKEVQSCDEFRPLAVSGPFEDAAFTFRAGPGAFEWTGAFGLRRAYALASALVSANDGLVDVGATTDALALGVVYLNGLAPIRALPRPGVLGKSMREIQDAMWQCGVGGMAVAVLFGWPQLLAVAIDEEATGDEKFRSVVDNIRNFAFALRTVAPSMEAMSGVVVASFVDAQELSWIAQELGGKPSTITVGKRAVTYYPPKSRWEPAIVRAPLDAGKIAWGMVFGGQSTVKWFWGKGGGSTAASAIGLGRANLPEILAQLAKMQAYFAPYYEEAAKRVGMLTGKLGIDNDVLTGTIKLEIK